MMTKSDGTKCTNANENAEVFREHFQKLFGRTPVFDPTVLDLLDSHPIHEGLDHPPTDLEIINATRNLKNNSPGESVCAHATDVQMPDIQCRNFQYIKNHNP